MTIKLHQYPPVWGRNVSPFTLKLETWLRLAGLPFEIVPTRNPRKGPTRKLPFIEDEDGTLIGDSGLIIEHLKRTRGVDPDAGLDAVQRAESLALQRLFEEHLYFVIVYSRWIDAAGWATVRNGLFGFLPPVARHAMAELLRVRVRADLRAQGLGRHRRDDIYAMGHADLEAIAALLNDGPFFFRDRPTSIDAVAYGFLANILLVPIETEIKRSAESFANLRRFVAAMDRHLEGRAAPADVEPVPTARAA